MTDHKASAEKEKKNTSPLILKLFCINAEMRHFTSPA